MGKYIIGLDQSTQGTKALLFNEKGELISRADKAHRQFVNEKGWVSHDLNEIFVNTLDVVRDLVCKTEIDTNDVVAMGICNQRETSCLWNKVTGEPIDLAVVWQCARGAQICERDAIVNSAEQIFESTGLKLSPYFPAAKIAWLLENNCEKMQSMSADEIGVGTIDTYLLSRLTNGEEYKTDVSNASRTQLLNIAMLEWDAEICGLFGIDVAMLPEVCDSNSVFGYTDCGGFFEHEIPITAMLGDSHAALFGQNCLRQGEAKATYGTGSSIMMNIGAKPILSQNGLVTSLAWSMDGKAEYVLEGNLNYTGAVITWLKDDMGVIADPGETEQLAKMATKDDSLYLVPAFSGLGAPYWDSSAKAAIVGMDRTTGKAELVRAALESIAYQISDIIIAMEMDSGRALTELRVDGGPTKNRYLMQFQSDILNRTVAVPDAEELSGIGVAYMAGMKAGLFDKDVFENIVRVTYSSAMMDDVRKIKRDGWKAAVNMVIGQEKV